MDLNELQAKAAEIAAAISEIKSTARAIAIGDCRQIMADNGLTVADLGAAPRKRSTSVCLALYRNASGQTWAGRGKRPNWLRTEIDKGRALEEFKIAA